MSKFRSPTRGGQAMVYFGLHGDEAVSGLTCVAMVFIVGSRSLRRSKPWWKKVYWAWK